MDYVCQIKETGEIVEVQKNLIVPLTEEFVPKPLLEEIKNRGPGNYVLEVKLKYDENLVKIIPLSEFRRFGINPVPGMVVNVDGRLATIRAVSGGRVIVDFNHPFAGKTLVFYVNYKRDVEDINEKAKALSKLFFGKEDTIEIKEGRVEIKENIEDELKKRIEELLK